MYAALTFLVGLALGVDGYFHHSTFLPELRLLQICAAAIIVLMSLGSFFNLKMISARYSISVAAFGGWLIFSGLRCACDKPRLADALPWKMLAVFVGLLLFLPLYSTWRLGRP